MLTVTAHSVQTMNGVGWKTMRWKEHATNETDVCMILLRTQTPEKPAKPR